MLTLVTVQGELLIITIRKRSKTMQVNLAWLTEKYFTRGKKNLAWMKEKHENL